MARVKSTVIPPLTNWGGVRSVLKRSSDIPEHALHAIKSIKVNSKKDSDGNVYSTLDIELYEKVGVLRLPAKASGLLDNPDDGSEKLSVIDINVVAPRGEA
jgi:hypothetical protein